MTSFHYSICNHNPQPGNLAMLQINWHVWQHCKPSQFAKKNCKWFSHQISWWLINQVNPATLQMNGQVWQHCRLHPVTSSHSIHFKAKNAAAAAGRWRHRRRSFQFAETPRHVIPTANQANATLSDFFFISRGDNSTLTSLASSEFHSFRNSGNRKKLLRADVTAANLHITDSLTNSINPH